MQPTVRRTSSPRSQEWMLAIGLGLVLGALVLGGGGRFAMRGISLLEQRPRQWTLGGTLRVIAFGAGFGAVTGLLRAAAATWLGPRVTARQETALFVALGLGLAVVGLTPLSRYRLALFLPVVALFLWALEHGWRRAAGRGMPAHGATGRDDLVA